MDIYEYHINTTLPRLEQRIRESDCPESNKKAILDFENFLFAEGLKPIGILKYMQCLKVISQLSQKDFKSMDRVDIQAIAAHIERSDRAEKTKIHYRITLKKFFRWLQGEENAAAWINTSPKRCEKKLPEDLLTEKDVKILIDASNHPRDKALIALLYDSGCRIGEIGTLKIKNVSFDQYGGVLSVHGKTGSRRVRIMFSTSYISSWLDIHPFKENPDAYLFVKTKGAELNKPMRHHALLMIIRNKTKKAGLTKRIHPHIFRHSRATELAKHLTEAQMNSHLGWVPGSGMSGVYVHLSGRDVDDAILGMYGKKKEEERLPELTSKICMRCRKENGPTSSFCTQCGSPLNIQAVQDVEDSQRKLMQTIEMLMKTEDFKALWDKVSVGNDQ